MNDFLQLGLPRPILGALDRMKFAAPTPIQALAIPVALEGRDILGSAQTGTGKTGAFAIPLLTHLIRSQNSSALVLAPTRELATQVMQVITQLLDRSLGIKTALLIGGDSMGRQLDQLRRRPRIIVGTPGRINDHLERESLRLGNADFLVLDETDRMLDMGFGIQIDRILAHMPAQRQTLMFSATLPKNIVKLSSRYLRDPERIAVGTVGNPAENIRQEVIKTSHEGKYAALVEELNKREGSIIVFVKTKFGADKLARKLSRENHSADAIHGDLKQNRRDRVIRAFREKRHRVMVATDVAARGLDIPHIEHVINYDLPQCPEDYIHRIGRTARAGAAGSALCFVTPADNAKWRAIDRLLNGKESSDGAESGEERREHRRSAGAPSQHRRKKRWAPHGSKPSFGGPEGNNGGGKGRSFKGKKRGPGGDAKGSSFRFDKKKRHGSGKPRQDGGGGNRPMSRHAQG